MSKRTKETLLLMLNAFPQSQATDMELVVRTYVAVVAEFSEETILKTASRYTSGAVPGHEGRFAPTTAEFCIEARKVAETLATLARRKMQSLPPRSAERDLPPFMVLRNKLLKEFEGREVLVTDMTHAQFIERCRRREFPVGATYIAALGTLFGPPKTDKDKPVPGPDHEPKKDT